MLDGPVNIIALNHCGERAAFRAGIVIETVIIIAAKRPGDRLVVDVYKRQAMVKSGYREIVLTGIHLGLYGADLEQVSLGALLDELEKIPDLVRIRLSSIEPSDITRELVERIVSSEKICPHLHIPLQSGDKEILSRMNRPYTPEEYLYLVRWLRELRDDLAVSADVMVGFPGETEEHHRRSLAFVRGVRFSRLHVFTYSPRPGTAAAEFPGQVERAVKERRSRERCV